MIDLSEKVKGIRHAREREFALAHFAHDDWDCQPRAFELSDGTKYYPDFRDNKTGEFIEVIGSRQAFHKNKKKYLAFMAEYPSVRFSFYLHTGKKASVFTGRADLSITSPPSWNMDYSYPTTRCNYDLRFLRKRLDMFFMETRWTYGMFNRVAGLNLMCVDTVLSGSRPYCSERDFYATKKVLDLYDCSPADFVKIENKFSVPIKAITARKKKLHKYGECFYYPGRPFNGATKSNGKPA